MHNLWYMIMLGSVDDIWRAHGWHDECRMMYADYNYDVWWYCDDSMMMVSQGGRRHAWSDFRQLAVRIRYGYGTVWDQGSTCVDSVQDLQRTCTVRVFVWQTRELQQYTNNISTIATSACTQRYHSDITTIICDRCVLGGTLVYAGNTEITQW